MTRRELDIFIMRGLIGIMEMMDVDNHPTDEYPAEAKKLAFEYKDRIVKWLDNIIIAPTKESHKEVSTRELDTWFLKGLGTLANFVSRRAELEKDLDRELKLKKLSTAIEKLLVELA